MDTVEAQSALHVVPEGTLPAERGEVRDGLLDDEPGQGPLAEQGVGGRRFGRQGGVTGRASRGHEGYDLGDPMAGQAEENGAGMARLSTGLASARLLGDGRRSGGRVGRRRQVGGVQAEPRLEVTDFGLQFGKAALPS